jgi:hypothetical protein
MSPLESESRIAAQLAPFTTVELMPYFLNSPFSWAITIGEQSVSAIMPKRMSGVSGLLASRAAGAAETAGFAEEAASDLLQAGSAAAAARVAAWPSTARRVSLLSMGVPPSGG